MQLFERRVREGLQQSVRLRARATFLEMASGTLAVVGLFSLVFALGSTTAIAPRFMAGLPLLVAAAMAAWARHTRQRARRNDRRIQKMVRDVGREYADEFSALP